MGPHIGPGGTVNTRGKTGGQKRKKTGGEKGGVFLEIMKRLNTRGNIPYGNIAVQPPRWPPKDPGAKRRTPLGGKGKNGATLKKRMGGTTGQSASITI